MVASQEEEEVFFKEKKKIFFFSSPKNVINKSKNFLFFIFPFFFLTELFSITSHHNIMPYTDFKSVETIKSLNDLLKDKSYVDNGYVCPIAFEKALHLIPFA